MGMLNWLRYYRVNRRKRLVGSLTPEEMANARIRFETSWEAAQQARQDARDTNADARAQARAEAAHAQAWNTAHTKAQKNLYNATKAGLRRGVDWTRARMSHRNAGPTADDTSAYAAGGGAETIPPEKSLVPFVDPNSSTGSNKEGRFDWKRIADEVGGALFIGAVNTAGHWLAEHVQTDPAAATSAAYAKVAGQLNEHFPQAFERVSALQPTAMIKEAFSAGTKHLDPAAQLATRMAQGLIFDATANPYVTLASPKLLGWVASRYISTVGDTVAGAIHVTGSALELGSRAVNAVQTGVHKLQEGVGTRVESLQQGIQARVDAAVDFISRPFRPMTPQPQPVRV